MRIPLVLALLMMVPASGQASDVRSWSASTARQFSAGTFEGTALDNRGGVTLAPELAHLWGPAEGIVWAVVDDGAGGAYVALSGPARVLHVSAEGETEVWYEGGDENLVTALAAHPAGGLLFGLSPAGQLLRAARAGETETLAETPAQFIWALAVDDQGVAWVGTGLPGLFLRVAPDGETSHLFESGDDPVRALAAAQAGEWILGTGGRGRVIRIAADRRAFVLLDADQPEIVSVGVDTSGAVYALAADGAKRVQSEKDPARTGGITVDQAVRVVAHPPEGGSPDQEQDRGEAEPPAARPRAPKQSLRSTPGGVLYRIDTDGGFAPIWHSASTMPFALVVAGSDRLIVGTGDRGRILMLDGAGRTTRLLSVPSEQASALALAADGVLVGGSTDARVERLGDAPRPKGSYLGPAIDAGHVADWGRLRWTAEQPERSSIRFAARSGNSSEPDETWSAWSTLERQAGPSGVETGVPAARWLQIRADFGTRTGGTPRLTGLEVLFLPRNRAPRIESLVVDPAGVVWVLGPAQSSRRLGPLVLADPVARRTVSTISRKRNSSAIRKGYEAGARTFAWRALDPDGDRLTYSLQIQRDGDPHWFPLVEELSDSFHSWDARGMPDGAYRVRLTVDDGADNPSGNDLSAARVSDLFRIDNTRPSVGELEVDTSDDGLQVEFVAMDPGGSVAALEVARDGGAWEPLHPLDGVADSAEERYELWIGDEEPMPTEGHSLAVRVTDAAGNLGGDLWVIPEP